MKYRIRNRETKNFVSKPTSWSEASKYQKLLNQNCSDPDLFEIVSIEEELEKMPNKPRPMSEHEREAIQHLDKIKYNPGAGHSDFANTLIEKIEKNELEITEKQSAYLWFIIYHYRRQLNNAGLIAVAERNKLY